MTATMPRLYQYVGPDEIRESSKSSPPGTNITSKRDLVEWLGSQADYAEPDGSIIATFVINERGALKLAPRRSEHVACAAGGPVLSAGEITFAPDGSAIAISNQSTGFCPEPKSWPAVETALDSLPIDHPGEFTHQVIFRKCPACGERNIVKDNWFYCECCDSELPVHWNFSDGE